MTALYAWASRWNIPMAAIADLQNELGLAGTPGPPLDHTFQRGLLATEEHVSTALRLEAGRKGVLLWRNNVGALKREGGEGFVRFGLANDSEAVNKRIKSADFVGIKPVTVTQEMVGQVVGIFVSREVKAAGWSYTGTDREQAQQRWALLVKSFGGDACFVTGEGSL